MKMRFRFLIIGLIFLASIGLMGSPEPASAQSVGGFVVVTGDDADDYGHCSYTPRNQYNCGDLYPNLFTEAISRSRISGATKDILAIGVNRYHALKSFQNWVSRTGEMLGRAVTVTHVRTQAEIKEANFSDHSMIYIPSTCVHTAGGIEDGRAYTGWCGSSSGAIDQIASLNSRQPDIADYVNNRGGSLIALTQSYAKGAWGFLPVPLVTKNSDFYSVNVTQEMKIFSPTTNSSNLAHCCFHNIFTGPANYSGLRPLAMSRNTYRQSDNNKPTYLGGAGVKLTAEICTDKKDNDNDTLIDGADPDCQICGNGKIDLGETCDDGNTAGGDGCSSTCKLEAVTTNQPPEAVCQNVTVDADPQTCLATTSVDNGSSDPDGDPVTLDQTPAGPYGLGTTDVSLLVTDDKDVSDTCSAVVTVVDKTPPVIAGATTDPAELWPPNHKMVPVMVSIDVSDTCDTANGADTSCKIVGVTSDEEINGIGDGNTDYDWEITGSLSLNLRAERAGPEDGRVYTITLECTDASGNTSTSEVNISVPHDQKGKGGKP